VNPQALAPQIINTLHHAGHCNLAKKRPISKRFLRHAAGAAARQEKKKGKYFTFS
jgi:hypothetical protein